jgi:hypothetical protein
MERLEFAARSLPQFVPLHSARPETRAYEIRSSGLREEPGWLRNRAKIHHHSKHHQKNEMEQGAGIRLDTGKHGLSRNFVCNIDAAVLGILPKCGLTFGSRTTELRCNDRELAFQARLGLDLPREFAYLSQYKLDG